MRKSQLIKGLFIIVTFFFAGLEIKAGCPSSIDVCCGWNAIREAADDFKRNCGRGVIRITDLSTGHIHIVIQTRYPQV